MTTVFCGKHAGFLKITRNTLTRLLFSYFFDQALLITYRLDFVHNEPFEVARKTATSLYYELPHVTADSGLMITYCYFLTFLVSCYLFDI